MAPDTVQPDDEEVGLAAPESALKALCPKTSESLLQCPKCNKYASRWRVDRTYPWARVLYCSCGKDWAVCAFCEKSDTPLVTTKQMYDHNYNRAHRCDRKRLPTSSSSQEQSAKGKKVSDHNYNRALRSERKRPPSSSSSQEESAKKKKVTEDDDPVLGDSGDDENWVQTRNSPMKEKKEDSLLYPLNQYDDDERKVVCKLFHNGSTHSMRNFGNPQSTAYFNADINGSGIADIVAKCEFNLAEVGKKLHKSDVQYATDMAQFIHGLTHSQRDSLSRLLAGTVAKVDRDSRNKSWKTLIPTDPVLMRNHYWEGQKAFLCNVPCPSVYTLTSHAYTSVRDCIRDRLAFGFPLEKVETLQDTNAPVRTLIQSRSSQRVLRTCQHLYTEPVLVLFLKEWQDGYDPHAMSKNNRGSCWIKVVTISEPHDHRNCAQVSLYFWPQLCFCRQLIRT